MYNWVMGNESKKSRKKNRLKDFDYSSNASYFLTICSDRRKEIFSKIVYDEDYNTKAQYIDTNPLTWERDELYTER